MGYPAAMKTPRISSCPRAALPLERCLAKTRRMSGDSTAAGRTVEEHCRITGAIAAALARRLNADLPGMLPPGAHIPALLHDIGKVWIIFQAKIHNAIAGKNAHKHVPELAAADLTLDKVFPTPVGVFPTRVKMQSSGDDTRLEGRKACQNRQRAIYRGKREVHTAGRKQ